MIYFIQNGLAGSIKIGYTNTYVSKRLKSLQTTSSKRLFIMGCIKGDMKMEKQIHEHLQSHKLEGEWFKPSIFVLNYIHTELGLKLINHNNDSSKDKLLKSNNNNKILSAFEKASKVVLIERLTHFHGNKLRTANSLNISRSTLYAKLKLYNIHY